jgi:hypothetical protein
VCVRSAKRNIIRAQGGVRCGNQRLFTEQNFFPTNKMYPYFFVETCDRDTVLVENVLGAFRLTFHLSMRQLNPIEVIIVRGVDSTATLIRESRLHNSLWRCHGGIVQGFESQRINIAGVREWLKVLVDVESLVVIPDELQRLQEYRLKNPNSVHEVVIVPNEQSS